MLLQTQGNLIAAMVSPHPSQSHWVFCCNTVKTKQNKQTGRGWEACLPSPYYIAHEYLIS